MIQKLFSAMPRFLVPIDFSAISVNAALYAVQMAERMPNKEVVLYNVTQEIHAGVDGTPIDVDSDALVASNLAALEHLQVNLFEMGMSPMEIVAEVGDLHDKLKPAISKYKIDMVVMGIKGNSSYDDHFLGKNALDISRDNPCPVMIVPPEAMFKGSNKIAVAVEYKNVEETISIEPIKKWLDVLRPELHFLFIAPLGQDELSEEQVREKAKLDSMFAGYKIIHSIVNAKDFSTGVNKYIDEKNIDQVVVFPRKQSLFNSLFANDHTRKLAYHSHVPVITVHD